MPNQIIFICFSAISIPLVLLPVPWHWRSKNVATLIYVGWVLLTNAINLINALVWRNSHENYAPIWCDICIKIQVGFGPGLIATSLCINRRLANIATSRKSLTRSNSRRNNIIFDMLLGIGLPILIMTASYVVQPHRFDIGEDLGCFSSLWPVLPEVFLVQIWPVALSLISGIYGIVAISVFLRRRLQFSSILKGGHSGITTSQYLRLGSLAIGDLLISLPFSLYYLVRYCQKLVPWTSWDLIHEDFSSVVIVDEAFWQRFAGTTYMFTSHWLSPLSAILFFGFFGLSEEALSDYFGWINGVIDRLRIRRTGHAAVSRLPNLGTHIADSEGDLDSHEFETLKSHKLDNSGRVDTIQIKVQRTTSSNMLV